MEIKTVDSHLNLPKSYWKRLGKFYADNVWDVSVARATYKVQDLFLEYEREYAVKWLEITAYIEGKLVGCMRVLRNPDDRTKWFFGDVHTDAGFRRQGVASAMYESAISAVRDFYAAECIEASVSLHNTNSIGLHEKMGFVNTGRKPSFANLGFEEDEIIFQLELLTECPMEDTPENRKLLNGYLESIGKKAPDKIPQGAKLIFCGERVVGYKL